MSPERHNRAGSSLPQPGDVLAVPLSRGVAFCTYLGKHETLGDAILVLPGIHESHDVAKAVAAAAAGFVAFYPVRAASRSGLVRVVGFHPETLRPLSSMVRYVGNTSEDGRVLTWLITDGASLRQPRTVLSDEEKQLPIGTIWNHPLLVDRIESNWRP